MIRNAQPFLLNHLRQALRANAEELRFVSGQQPSFQVAGGLRPADGVAVRAEMVQALHEVCLAEAQRTDLRQASPATYYAAFKDIGEFRCEFRVKGNTKSLSLYPESEEYFVAEQRRKLDPPPIGDAVAPEEEG